MTLIHLEPLTRDNWEAVSQLEVAPSQRHLLPSNLFSIARAQFYVHASQWAICDREQTVGYALFGRDIFSGKWKIFHFMMDARFQRRGYGRAALAETIARINDLPDGDKILICYHSDNEAARSLYAGLGFVEQSDIDDKVTALWQRSGQTDDSG